MDKQMDSKATSTSRYSLCARSNVWRLGWRLAIWATRCVLKMHYYSCNWFIWWSLFLFCFCYILFVVSRVVISYVGDELAAVLEVGDNFIINAEEGNDEDVSFWLIMCTKPLHKVKAPFIDNWENSYEEGDDVVKGLYYQKWGNSDNSLWGLIAHLHH